MKRWTTALLAAAFVVTCASVACAQAPLPEAAGADDPGVVYKKETQYDFEDDLVEGSLVKPDGAMVGGELHGKTSSLIKIRSDFIPEMIKSVEDL